MIEQPLSTSAFHNSTYRGYNRTDRYRTRGRKQNSIRSENGPITETYNALAFAAAPPVKKKSMTQITQRKKVITKTIATQFYPVKRKTIAVQTRSQDIHTFNIVNSTNEGKASNVNDLISKNEKNASSNTVNSAKVKSASKVSILKSKNEKDSTSIKSKSKTKTTKAKSARTHRTNGIPAKDFRQPIKNSPKEIPNASVYMRYQGQPMYVSEEELDQNRTERAQHANKMVQNAASTVRRYQHLTSLPTDISGLKVVKETPKTKSKSARTHLTNGNPAIDFKQPNKNSSKEIQNASVYMRYQGQPMYVSEEELAENRTERSQHANKMIQNAASTVRRYKHLTSLPTEISGLKVVKETPKTESIKQISGLEIYRLNTGPRSKSVLSILPNTSSQYTALTTREYNHKTSVPNETLDLKRFQESPELKLVTEVPGLQIYQFNPDPQAKTVLSLVPNTSRF